ncbi:MAG: DAK2 domain-containing protein [Acidimicrobiia bacterium]|nr:DAK2 domain-containing protein [Acidimicrobiia bacterium]MDH5236172.1 DAK2 domain-containing protein [Acidimicrobiia bacterium]
MSARVLDAATLRSVVATFRDALAEHREAINVLNVYPVPDGDTGTNMALTLESVATEVDAAGDDLAAVCAAISHGSLMGARGNSGVIMCQLLRGLSEVLAETPADGAVFARALSGASTASYGAVGNPVEGTILTVAREAAESATDVAGRSSDLVVVLDAARTEAAASLERTPQLLPVLADAGVVDAGGAGFLLFLDAMLAVVDGRDIPEPDVPADGPILTARSRADGGAKDVSELRYEVMYFLDAPDHLVDGFKAAWAGIGDSIVVVGGDGTYNCHVHTDDIGAAVEAGIAVGRPHGIRVTDLLEEVAERDWVNEALGGTPPQPTEVVPTAVVAVCVGDGVEAVFRSLGVHGVVRGGQTMNPSTAQLLEAVEASPGEEVIILPNNKNIIPVAEQVDQQSTKTVRVVPTRGIAEGFASLLEYDPQAPVDDNHRAMSEAAEAVLAGEVTRAVRDAASDVGPIAEGDWIGINRSGIRAVADGMVAATVLLLTDMLEDGHEILTVIVGTDATDDDVAELQAWVGANHPDLEVEVHQGGQPLYPFYVGIE